MRARKKSSLSVLTTVFGIIIIAALLYSFKTAAIFEKSSESLTSLKRISEQEKVKYRYIGMEKCASVCHNNKEMGFQYDIMKTGPHSKAFKILISEKAGRYAKRAGVKVNTQECTACLKCHITGAGLDSSFFASTYKKEDGVTCEACHKGAFITKTFIPKEEDCLKCHNNSVHKIHRFDFKDNCDKIVHPRPKAML